MEGRREREREETHDKAESEPRIALDDVAGVVAAVVAATHDALVALDFLAEGVLAAGEDEAHGRERERKIYIYSYTSSIVMCIKYIWKDVKEECPFVESSVM